MVAIWQFMQKTLILQRFKAIPLMVLKKRPASRKPLN